MFDDGDHPRIFALPPGADFPDRLVQGLISRHLGAAPEAMARVTVYLNTTRMLRRVRAAFDGQGARFLPKLRLVTDIARAPVALPLPVPALRRRLEIAQLVARLMEQQTDFAPGTARFDLADSLADLMDEMQGEGVTLDALEAENLAANHAEHWQRSLAFIRIVGQFLSSGDAPDPEGRQRKVIELLVHRWRSDPPAAPIIVAGSTGSRGATAMLMEAVTGLPQGAVVLPGFDFDMPETGWNSLDSGPIPAEDHPQYRFRRLTQALGISAADVRLWHDTPVPCPARNRLVSLALRPAPVTDQWMQDGRALDDIDIALRDVTLIEADTPRAEALSIALILRKAIEDGRHAALISPDRALTRRVSAALDRWRILPDDSAGLPLLQSAPGRFLRHVAAAMGRPLTIEALLTLIKHPLTNTGAEMRGDHLRFSRDLELFMRRHSAPILSPDDLRKWAKADPKRDRWANWLIAALDGVEQIADLPLLAMLETHLRIAETLASGPDGAVGRSELWETAAGIEAARVIETLRTEAGAGGVYSVADYADLLGNLLQAGSVRQSETVDTRVAILGTLEARVLSADLVILGGLNEGVWPSLPDPDPWLSRQMRQIAGLLLPERQIGLSAHDFQQAIAAREVVLTRAARDAEAQTVASRWLNRLTNLLGGLPDQGGPEALAAARARGAVWLGRAERLESSLEPVPSAPRPAPRPPVAVRPRELPVTSIGRLIRDPYSVYAQRILRLRPLDPLRPEPDAMVRGQVIHMVLERFIRDRPPAEATNSAARRLLSIAAEVLAENVPWPMMRQLWMSHLGRIAMPLVIEESSRQAAGSTVLIEEKGSARLDRLDFVVTARPDRIDRLTDGRVHIYDYKTGKPPTAKQQAAFDKQLLLEAAMAERGAFADLGPVEVAGATYIGLGTEMKQEPAPLTEGAIERVWDELHRLIAAYLSAGTGYASRRAMTQVRYPGDYDHLARFGEWEMSDRASPEDVG